MYQINLKVKNPKSKIFLNPANSSTLHFLSCLAHCVYYKKTRECQEIQRRQREDQETSKVEEPIIGEDRVEMGQNLLDLKILDFKKLPSMYVLDSIPIVAAILHW